MCSFGRVLHVLQLCLCQLILQHWQVAVLLTQYRNIRCPLIASADFLIESANIGEILTGLSGRFVLVAS